MTKVVPEVPELRLTVIRRVEAGGIGFEACAAACDGEKVFLVADGYCAKIVESAEASGIETGGAETLAIKRQLREGESKGALEFSHPPSIERLGR